jgi:hypothetical protein
MAWLTPKPERKPEQHDCLGFVILCPDGKQRGYPYHNKGDADFDAGAYTEKGRCRHKGCTVGKHTVEPVMFRHDSQPDADKDG